MFCIAGYSNSGKTTLITKVVRTLSERGYRVATVKNSKENVLPPQESDTFRHLDAGAITSVLLGPSSSTVVYKHRIDLKALKEIDADFLLIEGMKDSAIPKIWCTGLQPLNTETIAPETVAIVSWKKEEQSVVEKSNIPVFVQSDIEKVIEIIEIHSKDIFELDEVLR